MANRKISEYEKERNKLIPHAERYANEKEGANPTRGNLHIPEDYAVRWNKCFLHRMDYLARQAGLI